MRRPDAALALLVTVGLLAACGTSGSATGSVAADPAGSTSADPILTTGGPSPSSSGGPTSSAPTEQPTSAQPTPVPTTGERVTLTGKDDGTVQRAARGTTVVLSLDSTYWTIDGSPDSTVAADSGPESHQPASTCLPGVGCGTVERSYVTVGAGTVTLTAHRTVCGEAMACTPAESTFAVRLIVN